jgi:methyl-accepting chemotaxis protein
MVRLDSPRRTQHLIPGGIAMETEEKKRTVYKRRVRNILIHKPMQREFTFVMISLLMVSTMAIAFVIHETIREVATGGGFQFGKINACENLSEISQMLIMRVSSILFVTLMVIGVFGVFFLHRVAGPVYRFRQIFMRINDGEYPNLIKLREGDFFSETAAEINRLIQKLRADDGKIKKLKEQIGTVQQKVDKSQPLYKEIQDISDLL